MKNFVSSNHFAWFCFGVLWFVLNLLHFLLIIYIKKTRSEDAVREAGLHKIKSPAINMVLMATVCITSVLDYIFKTNLLTINILVWFIAGVVFLIKRIIKKLKRGA